MELADLKVKLEVSSLMDTINGHVLSFTQIVNKGGRLSGQASLEDESGEQEDKEADFLIHKEGEDIILQTSVFTGKPQKFKLLISKYSIDFKLAGTSNPHSDLSYIINTN